MNREFYSEAEWGNRILSIGRLVDIRNFPDTAADALLGKEPAVLGRMCGLKIKCIDPKTVGAVVIWTKGPLDLLINHSGLLEMLNTYKKNKAVVGLMVTVTGFGGTFIEPGIPTPKEIASQMGKLFKTGLIDPEAVVLRYDPLMKLRTENNVLLRNDTDKAMKGTLELFKGLGIRHVESKPLLAKELEGEKYNHVWKRLLEAGLKPEPFSEGEIIETFARLQEVTSKLNMTFFSCCLRVTHHVANWKHDAGCLNATRLTKVGKKLFGEKWDRITSEKRPSRQGCNCSAYWDLSYIKGHKKCGASEAACLYCTACSKVFSNRICEKVKAEKNNFLNKRTEKYSLLA